MAQDVTLVVHGRARWWAPGVLAFATWLFNLVLHYGLIVEVEGAE